MPILKDILNDFQNNSDDTLECYNKDNNLILERMNFYKRMVFTTKIGHTCNKN